MDRASDIAPYSVIWNRIRPKPPLPGTEDNILTEATRFHLFKKYIKNMLKAWRVDKARYLQRTTFEDFIGMSSSNTSICSHIAFHEPVTADDCYPLHFFDHQQSEGDLTMGKRSFAINILHLNPVSVKHICCVHCFMLLACVGFLKEMGFIEQSVMCLCGHEMSLRVVADHADGIIWFCDKITAKANCCMRRSVLCGTWLALTSIPVYKKLLLCYMFINQYSKHQVISELQISSAIYDVWEQFFLRVIGFALRNSYSADVQISSCSSKNPLIQWVEEYDGEGMFIKFLDQCAHVYSNDTKACSRKRRRIS